MNDVYNRKLRNNVIKFLEASTMSKTDFAKGVGMSKQTLNAWLKDDGKVEIESNDKKWLYT